MRWLPASTQAAAFGVGMTSAKAAVRSEGLRLESPVGHPVVRTHPVTRRKALWVSTSFTVRIVGEGIESDADGTITKVLVENGQPVEYGEPLFLVDPS